MFFKTFPLTLQNTSLVLHDAIGNSSVLPSWHDTSWAGTEQISTKEYKNQAASIPHLILDCASSSEKKCHHDFYFIIVYIKTLKKDFFSKIPWKEISFSTWMNYLDDCFYSVESWSNPNWIWIFCHVRTGLCPIGYAHPVLTYLFLAYAEDTRRHFNFHKASIRCHRRRSDVL